MQECERDPSAILRDPRSPKPRAVAKLYVCQWQSEDVRRTPMEKKAMRPGGTIRTLAAQLSDWLQGSSKNRKIVFDEGTVSNDYALSRCARSSARERPRCEMEFFSAFSISAYVLS